MREVSSKCLFFQNRPCSENAGKQIKDYTCIKQSVPVKPVTKSCNKIDAIIDDCVLMEIFPVKHL
jgi:hypothetical protein